VEVKEQVKCKMDASNSKEIRNSSRSTGFRDEISSDTGETLMLAIIIE
jgi:hypothetical protein